MATYWMFIRGEYVMWAFPDMGGTRTKLVFNIVLIVFALMCAYAHKISEFATMRKPLFVMTFPFLTTVCLYVTIFMPNMAYFELLNISFGVAAFIVSTIGWGNLYLTLRRQKEFKGLPYLTTLSFVFYFGVSALCTVTQTAQQILPASSAISGICLYVLVRFANPYHVSKDNTILVATQNETDNRIPQRQIIIYVVIGLLTIVSGFLAGTYTGSSSDGTPSRSLQTLFFALALTLFIYLATRLPKLHTVIWAAILFVLAAGCFVAVSGPSPSVAMASQIITAGRRCLWMLFFLFICEASLDDNSSVTKALMIFYTASYGLSRVVIDLTRIFDIKTVIPSASLELATQGVTLAFVASAFIIIGYGLANSMPKTQDSLSGILSLAKPKKEGQLSNLGLESIPQDGSLDSSGGLTDHVLLKTEGISDIRYEACKSIGKKYDLTERELVVLTYLSQGHTNQHIAGEMYISINTVKTHTQAIYNKTGCHSKQEVINLIDQTIAKR